MDLKTVLASAAVGSLVSGAVIAINGLLERKARRRELLFERAFELAKDRTNLLLELVKANPQIDATFRDAVFLADRYYRWLLHLDKHGSLPPDAHEKG